MPRPDNGLPEDIREHMRLMCDIVALGFQTDKTRVATLLLCRDISGLFYPFLDVRSAHHSASHDDRSEAYERVSRYYCSQLAYLASRLDAMPEGDGHRPRQLLPPLHSRACGRAPSTTPARSRVLLAGGLGGTLETGRVLDYTDRGTTTASSAACTSRSWTAWASSSTASATPTPASPGSERRRGPGARTAYRRGSDRRSSQSPGMLEDLTDGQVAQHPPSRAPPGNGGGSVAAPGEHRLR